MNIEKYTLQQCIDTVRIAHQLDSLLEEPIELGDILRQLSERIDELTRWIPVDERLPNKDDGDNNGYVITREVENGSPNRAYNEMVKWDYVGKPDYFYTVLYWKRIAP